MQHETRTLAQAVRRALYGTGIGAAALGLAACGGGGGSGNGSLSVGVTDAPVDSAKNVYVKFSSVTLVPADGDESSGDGSSTDSGTGESTDESDSEDDGLVTIQLDDTQRIDLLEQQNGKRKLLIENESIPAGQYDQVRLGVEEATLVLESGDGPIKLKCPSCSQSGLKLNTDALPLDEGGTLDLTIDFDLRKSVVKAGSSDKYILKPTLRLVRTEDTGSIEVTASGNYVSNNQCGPEAEKNAVYVFEDDVTPDDVDGQDPDPITTVLDSDDTDGKFTGVAAYLEPGTYTVTYVCDAELDNPPEGDNTPNSEELDFRNVETVDVKAGETATYDLTVDQPAS